jgi:hypothetical protein
MDVSIEQAREWCWTTTLGSEADLAVQGLTDAGVDADLVQPTRLSAIRGFLEEGRPPIILLAEGPRWYRTVVVCAITDTAATVMDPRIGAYTDIPLAELQLAWLPPAGEVLLVGGHPANAAER